VLVLAIVGMGAYFLSEGGGGAFLEGRLVYNLDGTITRLPYDYQEPLELGWWAGSCSSDSECRQIAQPICDDLGKVLDYPGFARCMDGACNYYCVSPTICVLSECQKQLKCEYCIITPAYCDGNKCVVNKCGTYSECGGATCNNDIAYEECEDLAGVSRAVEDYGCTSDGDVWCDFMPRGNVECSRRDDPVCSSIGTQICGSADMVSQAYCNVEKDCNGEVVRSNCVITCRDPQPICGDGTCDLDETAFNCPEDCGGGGFCGDGECGTGETPTNCPQDCSGSCTPSYVDEYRCDGNVLQQKYISSSCVETWRFETGCLYGCLDGRCLPEGGNEPYCGDGICNGDDTCENCPEDCATPSYCGDGTCDSDETYTTCPEDCYSPYCGDGMCDIGETFDNCPGDCPLTPLPEEDWTIYILLVVLLAMLLGLFYVSKIKK